MATKRTVEVYRCDKCTSGEVIMDITIKDIASNDYVDITRSIRKCNECKTQHGLKGLSNLEKLY